MIESINKSQLEIIKYAGDDPFDFYSVSWDGVKYAEVGVLRIGQAIRIDLEFCKFSHNIMQRMLKDFEELKNIYRQKGADTIVLFASLEKHTALQAKFWKLLGFDKTEHFVSAVQDLKG